MDCFLHLSGVADAVSGASLPEFLRPNPGSFFSRTQAFSSRLNCSCCATYCSLTNPNFRAHGKENRAVILSFASSILIPTSIGSTVNAALYCVAQLCVIQMSAMRNPFEFGRELGIGELVDRESEGAEVEAVIWGGLKLFLLGR